MKVIIAGSREFNDFNLMVSSLNSHFKLKDNEVTEIVSGGARGADRLGEQFAALYMIPVTQFIPDWNGKGKAAGFIRNAEMAKYADALVAFWDGKSKGTEHMINFMKSLGKPVKVIHFD